MKVLLSFLLSLLYTYTHAQLHTLQPGEKAPSINLKNVDGKTISFTDYTNAKGFILVFTCNTCPYSKRYEQRVIQLNDTFAKLGFPVLAVNPNDPELSPGDSFEEMKKHAASSGFTFPYLYDEKQTATLAYEPKSTPTAFVLNKTGNDFIIAYVGAIDNDAGNAEKNKTNYVADAVTALLNNQQPPITITKAIGCRISIKKN